MKTLIPLLVCLTLSASACVIRGDGRKIAYGIDGVAVVAGAAMMVNGKAELDECDSRPSSDDDTHGGFGVDLCGLGGGISYEAGKVLMAVGGLAMLLNYAVNQGSSKPEQAPLRPQPMVMTASTIPPPSYRSPACVAQITAWRQETNPDYRTKRYDAMTADCQASLWLEARVQQRQPGINGGESR